MHRVAQFFRQDQIIKYEKYYCKINEYYLTFILYNLDDMRRKLQKQILIINLQYIIYLMYNN